MARTMTVIESEGMQIAASIESHDSSEQSMYYPSNVLVLMEQGQFNVRTGQQLFCIHPQNFGLIRKYTPANCFKTWGEHETGAVTYAFVLQDEFIEEVIQNVPSQPHAPIDAKVLLIEPNPILKGFFQSIISYIKENTELDRAMLKLKTQEALMGIIHHHPEYLGIFRQFAQPQRADLADFMNHNYQYNLSLDRLAKMSGRSLSTFNREFKAIFSESPHKWIMKRRLHKARELLLLTDRRASDIYLDLGFEDLAHFSRSFKKEFGRTPTEVKDSAA